MKQIRLGIWRKKVQESGKAKVRDRSPGNGADELALRAHEHGVVRSFIDTTNVRNKRWEGAQLVDEDWHASCQAIYKGVEGREWETMYFQFQEMHHAVYSKKSDENNKAKVLWALTEAKDKGIHCCDAGHEKKKIQTRLYVEYPQSVRAKKKV